MLILIILFLMYIGNGFSCLINIKNYILCKGAEAPVCTWTLSSEEPNKQAGRNVARDEMQIEPLLSPFEQKNIQYIAAIIRSSLTHY